MYNRHNKQEVQLNEMGNNARVDPFGSNAAAALAYKKMERLVTATHMVTNYVPKNESLRGRVRDIVSDLLSDTIKLRDGFTSLGKGTIGTITAQVRLVLSLLDALYASGLISEMNLKVLKEAYTDFIQNLSAMAEGSANDAVVLTPEYFSQSQESAPTSAKAHTYNKRVIKKALQVQPTQSKKQPKAPEVKPSKSPVQKKGSERVQTIIDFITKRGSASTGEVAELITECSSKTLQRDLTKLVQDGIFTKEGEKRWTRYSLAQQ